MTWEEVCADPRLQALPFELELRGRDKIVLRPIYPARGEYQGIIGPLLH